MRITKLLFPVLFALTITFGLAVSTAQAHKIPFPTKDYINFTQLTAIV